MSSTIVNTGNVMKSVYEPSLEALRVTTVASGSPTVPNIVRLTDGTDYLTTTTVGSDVALDVNIINALEINISHVDDSIRLGDGTNLITSTTVGSDIGLDVNILNSISSSPLGLSTSGSFVELSISSTVWTLITVTDVARNHVWLQNQSDVAVKLNPSNAGGYTGIIIEPSQSVNIDVKQAIPLYLRSASGSGKIVGRLEFA